MDIQLGSQKTSDHASKPKHSNTQSTWTASLPSRPRTKSHEGNQQGLQSPLYPASLTIAEEESKDNRGNETSEDDQKYSPSASSRHRRSTHWYTQHWFDNHNDSFQRDQAKMHHYHIQTQQANMHQKHHDVVIEQQQQGLSSATVLEQKIEQEEIAIDTAITIADITVLASSGIGLVSAVVTGASAIKTARDHRKTLQAIQTRRDEYIEVLIAGKPYHIAPVPETVKVMPAIDSAEDQMKFCDLYDLVKRGGLPIDVLAYLYDTSIEGIRIYAKSIHLEKDTELPSDYPNHQAIEKAKRVYYAFKHDLKIKKARARGQKVLAIKQYKNMETFALEMNQLVQSRKKALQKTLNQQTTSTTKEAAKLATEAAAFGIQTAADGMSIGLNMGAELLKAKRRKEGFQMMLADLQMAEDAFENRSVMTYKTHSTLSAVSTQLTAEDLPLFGDLIIGLAAAGTTPAELATILRVSEEVMQTFMRKNAIYCFDAHFFHHLGIGISKDLSETLWDSLHQQPIAVHSGCCRQKRVYVLNRNRLTDAFLAQDYRKDVKAYLTDHQTLNLSTKQMEQVVSIIRDLPKPLSPSQKRRLKQVIEEQAKARLVALKANMQIWMTLLAQHGFKEERAFQLQQRALDNIIDPENHPRRMRRIMKALASIHFTDKLGNRAIHIACQIGNVQFLMALLQSHTDNPQNKAAYLKSKNKQGQSALYQAFNYEQVETIKVLIYFGVLDDVDSRTLEDVDRLLLDSELLNRIWGNRIWNSLSPAEQKKIIAARQTVFKPSIDMLLADNNKVDIKRLYKTLTPMDTDAIWPLFAYYKKNGDYSYYGLRAEIEPCLRIMADNETVTAIFSLTYTMFDERIYYGVEKLGELARKDKAAAQIQGLICALDDENDEYGGSHLVREAAIRELSWCDNTAVLPALIKVVEDKNNPILIRGTAIKALKEMKFEVQRYEKLLYDEERKLTAIQVCDS